MGRVTGASLVLGLIEVSPTRRAEVVHVSIILDHSADSRNL